MIDPPKATKGRRMSKKTRKKPVKKTSKKSVRTAPKKAESKAKAKTPAAKARRPAAITPAKRPGNPPVAKQLAAKAGASPARRSALTEGAKAPAFDLPRDGGKTVTLADYSGQKLVLFFYPRADTPGCTREAIDFTRLASAFAQARTAILGVSADPPRAQEAFRDKHALSIPLLSDEPHGMLEAYGVWGEKSMYGRTFLGIVRTTVLIGPDGRLMRIWRNVKVDGHADEVLAAAQAS
jgi:thioredoxin-dependent peroxiredoxin